MTVTENCKVDECIQRELRWEIERLEADLNRCLAALQKIYDTEGNEIARRALVPSAKAQERT
jgi:hypothetical protein